MPVRRMTPEEREQLFGGGVIIIGGHIPRTPNRSLASAQRDSGDAASSDDKRHGSPMNYENDLPLGNKNE
jgi:hypothetical protein